MDLTTVKRALASAAVRLEGRGGTARLDSELLLCAVLERDRAWLHAHPEAPLDAAVAGRFDGLVARRADGAPVAQLTGTREFWSLTLEVTPDTLIPRPDTETLVTAALEACAGTPPARAADLGTGSGAVALALATEWPETRFVATEASEAALEVARRNARRHGINRIDFRLQEKSLAKAQRTRRIAEKIKTFLSLRALRTSRLCEKSGGWCEALRQDQFGVIVSNPPYVADGDPHLDAPEIRHEPRAALAAGPDGLDALRAIAACAPARLEPGGWLLLEHGFDQADAVTRLLRDAGLVDIRSWHDLAGHARVTGGWKR